VKPGLQCVSWWVRRLPDCDPGGLFLRDVLQLPMLGQKGNNWDDLGSLFIFHAGGCFEFELMPGPAVRPTFERKEQQPEVPVFRSYAFDATLATIRAAEGVRILEVADEPMGRTAYFVDPSGSVNALREPVPTSTDPIDVAAAYQSASGGVTLQGLKPMPPGVHDLGWVQMHVADVQRELAFYRDVVGLDVLSDSGADGAVLHLGDVQRLELRPGGTVEEIVSDRGESPEMWMLRVRDMDRVVRDLKDAGVHFVNDPWWLTGGHLAYFVDPEGHLVGIQDHPEDGRPQEVEALRRWENPVLPR
jgi:predicted enzyme related to lactoylglutathione lyase